jgi:hypothetical protein
MRRSSWARAGLLLAVLAFAVVCLAIATFRHDLELWGSIWGIVGIVLILSSLAAFGLDDLRSSG